MRFLLRNWHLKLSAVALATVLYTGLVFSGSFTDSVLQVRVEQLNASRDVFVLAAEPALVEVRYRVSNADAASVTAGDIVVQVDFADYDMDRAPEPQQLPVVARSLRDGIEILQPIEPETIRVQLDRVEVRSVPVEVDPGVIPDGLEIDEPVVSTEEVEVRGPASVVSRIDRALALVDIPSSAIDVNEPVGLTLVDIEGQPVGSGQVEMDPEIVSVQVEVRAVETETTVAVRPNIDGTPAPGFALESLRVEPAYVTIVGLPEVLAEIASVTTAPLSMDQLSADESFEVELELPDDVTLASGEPSTVTVTATIGPSVSSRTFVVGIVCEGAGDNACLPRVDQVAVTLSGSGTALSSISASALTPTVDASGLAPGNYDLTPTIGGLPDGVSLVGFSQATIPVSIVAPEPPPSPTPAP